MTENKTNTGSGAALVIAIVLGILGLFVCASQLVITAIAGLNVTVSVLGVIAYLVVLIYAISAYKKPHGNLLKYVLLIYATVLALSTVTNLVQMMVAPIAAIFMILCIAPVSFMAGRLNRLDENKIIMILTGILLLASAILEAASLEILAGRSFEIFIGYASTFAKFVLWIVICFIYVGRYEQHTEAGEKV